MATASFTTAAATTTAVPGDMKLTKDEAKQATDLLRSSAMFSACTEAQRNAVARQMEKRKYNNNENITKQGDPVDRFWIMVSGEPRRVRTEKDGARHHVNNIRSDNAISSLGVLEDKSSTYATVRCMSDEGCVAYTMARDDLKKILRKDASFQQRVIGSLSSRLLQSMENRTPLLEQKGTSISNQTVAIAAALESYPRSALNSVLNQKLTGVSSPLFPKMHVQIPLRIVYIAGIKGLRDEIDKSFFTNDVFQNRRLAVQVGAAIAPGMVMAPFGSLLEACNAGHSNPKPLLERATRGTVPRMMREMIFSIGFNQMSDYFSERWRSLTSSPWVADTAGSITAGAISGYLSHVPHTISALRLLNPSWSYRTVFRNFVDKSAPAHLVPASIPKDAHQPLRTAMACIVPRGIMLRTTKICVSFVVFNSAVKLLDPGYRKGIDGKGISAASGEVGR